MSNDEYVLFELKRFIAVLYFKYTTSHLPDDECIKLADKLLKELD